MQCERCNVEMEKKTFGSGASELSFNQHYAFGDKKYGGHPVIAKSVYICPKCGKMEFNINE